MKTFFKKKFCCLKKISVILANPVLAKPSAESSKTKGGGSEPWLWRKQQKISDITAAVCSHYFRNNVIFIVKDWVILLRASLCSSIDLGRLRACLPARSGTFEAKYWVTPSQPQYQHGSPLLAWHRHLFLCCFGRCFATITLSCQVVTPSQSHYHHGSPVSAAWQRHLLLCCFGRSFATITSCQVRAATLTANNGVALSQPVFSSSDF